MALGRPSIFDQDVATVICDRLAGGESLRSVCRDEEMPAESTVRRWAMDDVCGFHAQYVRARELQAHALVEDTLDISDDGSNDWMKRNDPENPGFTANGEHMQRSRLRVDTRKWIAARILPKVYGDKVIQEHTGPNGGAIQIEDARKPIDEFMGEFREPPK